MPTTVATLKGNWVTSFFGWMLFNPLPERGPGTDAEFQTRMKNLPPMIGGYGWSTPMPFDPANPGTYHQREGYFLVTALIRIALDGQGGLKGVMEVIRGGSPPPPPGNPDRYRRRQFLDGTYTVVPDPDLPGGFQGTIQETHQGDGPDLVTWNYVFVVRNRDELEWMWKHGDYRPVLANGTFRRMHPGSD